MTESEIVATHPVVAVRNTVLFPHLLLPFAIDRAKSIAAVEECLKSEDKSLVVVPQRSSEVDDPTADDLFEVGCLGVVRRMQRADGAMQLLVQGTQRVELAKLEQETPFLRAQVRHLPAATDEGPEVEAQHRAVLELMGRMATMLQPPAAAAISQLMASVEDPIQQVYLLAPMLGLELEQALGILKAGTRLEALQVLHEVLAHEVQVAEIQQKIVTETQSEMTKEQREHVLRRQMRAIQEELGEDSPEKAEIQLLRERLGEAQLPENVHKEVEKELARLERMPPQAADHQLTRTYIELCLELPWGKLGEDVVDLQRSRHVLDEDHYDLDEVKERILEHLAVRKLNPEAKSPILCFVGPPGVGKTSLGQSIARSLERKFERLALGGLHDEAELRGHRRTYVGAMPGRVIQALRRAGVRNPVLMLDEVDKLGQDFRGDPAAALMEVLDPAQNFEFHDNYLDLPFDLSKVFFITTANTLDSIPRPLLDRMEILRLAGYSDEEKKHIARRYLIGRQRENAGLSSEQFEISDEVLMRVIRGYTREAGVRELERMLGRIARKVATRVVEGRADRWVVAVDDLPDVLGPERFYEERRRVELIPGVAPGLAWTQAGGEVMYIEAVLLPDSHEMRLTGYLGEVMKESAKAAQSYLWSHAAELGIDEQRVRGSGVHIHVPAGAVPKDGPSAGVAMATALASLYVDLAPRSDTAMTGEITLTGLVLPIGGVKEKVLAAHRAGMRRVLLPSENESDLRDLPAEVKDALEFVLVSDLAGALNDAIPGLAERPSMASA